EDGPDSHRTARNIEKDAEPPNGIPIENPPALSLRVGRKKRAQKSDHEERQENPAIGAILTLAGTQICLSEKRGARHQHAGDDKDGPSRMAEKRGKPTGAEDGQPEIDETRHNADGAHLQSRLRRWRRSRFVLEKITHLGY